MTRTVQKMVRSPGSDQNLLKCQEHLKERWGGVGKKEESRANDDRKGGRKKLPCLWFWFPEQRLQQFIIFLQAGPVWFNGRIKYALIN